MKKLICTKEVEEAEKALKDVIEKLVLKADKIELGNLIQKVTELNSEDYTPETFKVLMEVLTTVEKVYNNENATQEEVQEAYAQLNDAYEGLKKVEINKPITPVQPSNPDETKPSGPIQTDSGINNANKDIVKTGDSTIIISGLFAAVISGIAILLLKKKKSSCFNY